MKGSVYPGYKNDITYLDSNWKVSLQKSESPN